MTPTDATAETLRRLAVEYVVHGGRELRASFGGTFHPLPLVFASKRGEEQAFEELRLLGYVRKATQNLAAKTGWVLTERGMMAILRGLVPSAPTDAQYAILEIVARYDLERHTRRHDYVGWITNLMLHKKLGIANMSENDARLSSMSRWYLHPMLGKTQHYKLTRWGWLSSSHKDKAHQIIDGLVRFVWSTFERDDQEDLNIRFTIDVLRDGGFVQPDVDPYLVQELVDEFRLGNGDAERGWLLSEGGLKHFLALQCKTGDEYLNREQIFGAWNKNVVDVANGLMPMCVDQAPIDFLRSVLQIAQKEAWRAPPSAPPAEFVWNVVMETVVHFRHMIEDCNGWRALWDKTDSKTRKPRHESMAQLFFEAIASVYCKINNLDITPEAGTGRGPVDFKISSGYSARVLVEVKLSTNPDLVHGYEMQLELYKRAQETTRAVFLVIDVGEMGSKLKRIEALRDAARGRGESVSRIEVVNGTVKPSASKA